MTNNSASYQIFPSDRDTPFPSADQFLDFLLKQTDKNRNGFSSLLFRGIGNADYTLLPSAFRKDGRERLMRIGRISLQPTNIKESDSL